MLEPLVDGHEYVATPLQALEQDVVAKPSPSHFRYGRNSMTRFEKPLDARVHALIQHNAHKVTGRKWILAVVLGPSLEGLSPVRA